MRQLQKMTRAGIIVVSLLCLAAITNCGEKSQTVQAPESLVKDYLAKSQTMVDSTLVNFYVTEEQQEMTTMINRSIDSHKKNGSLQNLQAATFDFTGLQINVVEQKEEYIHDEPFDFMKVSANGSIVMKTTDNSTSININDVIILEKIGNDWKVTKKINPFG